MTEALIQFDDPPRGPEADAADASVRIAETLKNAGIDAPGSLYNESLALAREGHLGQAQARLQMLLCLDPDDADGLLLLAKVHAAQGRHADALAKLDAAGEAGALAPAGFREYLEAAIRAERSRDEERRVKVAAREESEVRSLRNETRILRSDNVRLETEAAESRQREVYWKWAALGASLFGTAVIVAITILTAAGDESAPAEVVASTAAIVEEPVEVTAPPPVEVAPVQVTAPPIELPATRTHVIGEGDTLYKLAGRYYGDRSRWKEIARANDVTEKTRLKLGQELVIP
ncbi:MAG: LysM peptidoglycan-binding domain-containing protein [Myxococcota bacterium]